MHYILVSLYLASRLWNLLSLPPFVDELLYIRWTESIYNNPSNLWLPVIEDGQPPLFFWLGAIIKSIFNIDTLLILRCLSIAAGLAVLILLMRLAQKLFSRKIAIISGFVYTFFPMFLWYDRLGMRESFITLASLIMIYGLVKRLLWGEYSGNYLIILGLILGLLTKGTAILFVPVIVLNFALYFRQLKLNRYDLYLAISVMGFISIIYFFANSIFDKGSTFLLSFSDIYSRIYPNFYSTVRWLIEYSTLPLVVMVVYGFVRLYYQKNSSLKLLISSLLAVLIIEIISASIYFPRYFLWTLSIWIIVIAHATYDLLETRYGKYLLALISIPVILFNYQIIFAPTLAPLPAIEKWQYISGWPSGYGIAELSTVAQTYPIEVLVVEQNEACKTGLPYYGLKNMTTILNTDLGAINAAIDNGQHVYVCKNTEDNLKSLYSLDLLYSSIRPHNQSSIQLYALSKLD